MSRTPVTDVPGPYTCATVTNRESKVVVSLNYLYDALPISSVPQPSVFETNKQADSNPRDYGVVYAI